MVGRIALTFDDGPDRVWTPRILAALSRRGSRATFFVQARRAAQNPELVEEMIAGGHEVAFHCLDHVRHSQRSGRGVGSHLEDRLSLLEQLDVQPRAWRTPWGIETDATRTLAAEKGLRLW